MLRPRLFASNLSARQRRVYGALTAWFLFVSLAMIWPVYPFFSHARPLVLGIPFSLAYLVGLLLISFAAGLALYRWEDRQGMLDEPSDAAAADESAAGEGGR